MERNSETEKQAKVVLWTPSFVLLCSLNFLIFAGMWMLPAMLPAYIHSLGAPAWTLGWIAGLTAIATIVSRPIAGYLVDRFGRRGVFSAGAIGMVVTCIGFALFPIIGAILAIRFIQGLAWGLTNTAAATIAADSIPKPRFGEGMGYFSLASSVAMIFTPALSLTVLYAYGGTTSVLICGCFFCLSLVASCFLVYQKLEQKTEGVRKTVERHAAQLDRAAGTTAETTAKATAGTTAETTTPALTRRNSVMAFIKNTLLERSALGVALLMALTSSSYALVQTFLPALLDGDAVGNISLFFVVMAVTAIIARPVFGVWADRRNYFEPALAAFIAMTISLVLIMMNMNLGTLLAGAVFQGVGYSAGFSLFMALATHSVSNPSRRGAAIATVMVGFDIGSGLTAVVFSAFVEIVGFAALFGFGALIALFGMVWVLFHRRALQ